MIEAIKGLWQKLVHLSNRMDKAANEKATTTKTKYKKRTDLLTALSIEECHLITEYYAGRMDGETYHQARKLIKVEMDRIRRGD
jgi:hypothetical protein